MPVGSTKPAYPNDPRPGGPFDLPRPGPAADAARVALAIRGWLLVGADVPDADVRPLCFGWADHTQPRTLPHVEIVVRPDRRPAFCRWWPPLRENLSPASIARVLDAARPFAVPSSLRTNIIGGTFDLLSPDMAEAAGKAVHDTLKRVVEDERLAKGL